MKNNRKDVFITSKLGFTTSHVVDQSIKGCGENKFDEPTDGSDPLLLIA